MLGSRLQQSITSLLTEKGFASIALVLYLFATAAFTYLNYQNRQAEHLSSVRSTLLTAAVSAEHIIGMEFSERFSPEAAPDPQIYRYLVKKLSNWVATLPVTYVYLLDQRGDTVYFVVGNQREGDNGASRFYQPYVSAPQWLKDSFQSTTPVYTPTYTNDWGKFLSVFVPMQRSDGSTYVLAADMDVAGLQQRLFDSAIKAAILTLIFILPLLLLIWLYFWLQRRQAQAFKHSLMFDSVTGLANSHQLQEDLYGAETNFTGILLSLVDTDDLNTLFGRTATDTLFTHIGKTLSVLLPKGAHLYRVRVREFFVLYEELEHDRVIALTQRLLAALNTTMPMVSKYSSYSDIAITAHAGVVVGVKKQRLVSRARDALMNAQELGRPFCFYQAGVEQEKRIASHYFWQNEVNKALQERRLLPYFQPIYDNRSHSITRYEILVRLQQHNGQVIGPNDFLAAVKLSYLYHDLTRSMIEQSFAIFSKRSESLSINLSKADLLDEQTPQYLVEAIGRYGMQGRVIIEVVESDWIGYQDEVLEVLAGLKQSGVQLAVDDFGSGYSNFDQLLKIDVDFLKIDGSLISSMFINDKALSMVKAIIALANGLNIPVIPEFVESQAMWDRLRGLGCDYAQGHVIGRAIPASELPPSA